MNDPADSMLTRLRSRAEYTHAERRFAETLQAYLTEFLEGRRDCLPLLRKYPRDASRLGVIPAASFASTDGLQLWRFEQLTWDALRFLQVESVGGPIVQREHDDGSLLELQTFATRYSDVVVERIDRYSGESADPDAITWQARRVRRSDRILREVMLQMFYVLTSSIV